MGDNQSPGRGEAEGPIGAIRRYRARPGSERITSSNGAGGGILHSHGWLGFRPFEHLAIRPFDQSECRIHSIWNEREMQQDQNPGFTWNWTAPIQQMRVAIEILIFCFAERMVLMRSMKKDV
jgi:hypothetical protein